MSAIANSASFNCSAQLNNVEKRICDNAVLSDLDDQLGALYKYRKVNTADKKDQINWIKKRNSCLNDECIEKAYNDRISLFTSSRVPIKKCLGTVQSLSDYAAEHTNETFIVDKQVDLNGDGEDEIIYGERMCNVHCAYAAYEKIAGCYYEIATFTAREYFVVSARSDDLENYLSKEELVDYKKTNVISNDSFKCLLINDVEQYGDLTIGPSYQPWCFSKSVSKQ